MGKNKTIKTLEKQEFVIQPNAISQSMYSASTTARRLMAMAMSGVEPDTDNYDVSFSVLDFIKALGIKRGSKTNDLIFPAVKECFENPITIKKDNEDWVVYSWFTEASLEQTTISMSFNPKLGKTIKALKKLYGHAKIDLIDLGKLQSRYAIRFYELALSYAGFEGQGGNRRSEWWFEHTISDIRALFQIEKNKYKLTKEFKRNVIDKSIEEINAAGIGLRIEPEYNRKGKWLVGVRFNCRWVKRNEPLPVTPTTETAQEDEQLMAAFPEEFEKYKAEELAKLMQQPDLPGFIADYPDRVEALAEERACKRLRADHPDFFKTKTK